MSDAPAPADKPAEPPAAKGGGGGKGGMIIGIVNLLATGFIAFKVVTAPAPAAAEAKPAPAATGAEVTGPVVPLDPFIVNLDEPGTSRYLKITLQVEMVGPEGELVVTKSKELIRDAILSYLSGLHVKDTLGAEAKDKIRTDLLARVTKLLGPDKVKRLFFQDFVVQ